MAGIGFIERTFQLSQGVGPWREKDLWARGVATWDDFEAQTKKGVVMAKRLDAELQERIELARDALKRRDVHALAKLIPSREHWRLYPHFVELAAFFDIEADDDDVPTVIGVMDSGGLGSFWGPRLTALPERLAASPIWVTFNGAVYDVPVLKRVFPEFPQPAAHVDLRFLVRKVRLKGGLKAIEDTLGFGRPPHLRGLKGLDAIRLWREWMINKDPKGLRLLIEYNLYDAINLRSVLEATMWRVVEDYRWELERTPIFERGDVLYDLSRLVLSVG